MKGNILYLFSLIFLVLPIFVFFYLVPKENLEVNLYEFNINYSLIRTYLIVHFYSNFNGSFSIYLNDILVLHRYNFTAGDNYFIFDYSKIFGKLTPYAGEYKIIFFYDDRIVYKYSRKYKGVKLDVSLEEVLYGDCFYIKSEKFCEINGIKVKIVNDGDLPAYLYVIVNLSGNSVLYKDVSEFIVLYPKEERHIYVGRGLKLVKEGTYDLIVELRDELFNKVFEKNLGKITIKG